jgi:hypothetical protein
VSCSASRVVPGAHRVVGPGTHRGSGPREVHTTPGPSNEAYLSSPHLEASPVTTFRASSSPAPKPVKPQSAPAILSQESVHTMLSITHHTRKRPSTGPRTTHGPHKHCFARNSWCHVKKVEQGNMDMTQSKGIKWKDQ